MTVQNQTSDTLPLPPGSRGLPLLGETLAFVASPSEFMTSREAQYGKIFTTNILGANTVVMLGPAANHWVFSGEGKYVQNRWNHAIRQLLGANSLSLLNGEAHKERRRILSPHFKYEAMASTAPKIENLSVEHLARWAEAGGILTIEHAMRQLAFEIIAAFIFGDEAEHLDLTYLSKEFQQWEGGMFSPVTLNLSFTPFGKAMQSKQAMMDYLKPLVEKRRASGKQADDVLGSLLAVRDSNGDGLSDETIVDEIQLMLFAGHDTTVTTNTNIMLLLAQHPDVLARARAEQDALSDEGRALTLENLKTMTYLDAVIHESMRVIAPIGSVFRMALEDLEFGGYRIPKGWAIMLNAGRTHLDETLWPNPRQFDPERWLRGEHKQQAFSHIPFGGGPRLCLGQNFAMVEMKIILALLLRGYQWTLTPGQDLTYRTLPFPLPKSGVQVIFSRR